MPAPKRRSQRSASKPVSEPTEAGPQLKRARIRGTSMRLAARKFVFEELPKEIRLRIYHFLGFPVTHSLKLSIDCIANRNTTIELRELYKVDVSDEGFSVPWNVSWTKVPQGDLELIQNPVRDE